MYDDDFDGIYGYEDVLGYLFSRFEDGKISDPIPLTTEQVNFYGVLKANEDFLFLHCVPCETFMEFEAGPDAYRDGKWTCPVCGHYVRERTAYSILDRLNIDIGKRNPIYYDDSEDYDD